MNLKEIYKIADSKEFYTKQELLETVIQTSSQIKAPKFKDSIQNSSTEYKITILFPIYNEESFLDYSLESFFNSYTYPNTRYQVIFFLNSCTDNSLEKTKSILKEYKEIKKNIYKKDEYEKLQDPGLERTFFYSEDQNSYYVLNTSTKGRVNALCVAMRMAKKNNSKVLMSFDTDFVLDPLTIYHLSKKAVTNIILERNTVAITGAPIIVNNKKHTRVQDWLRNHYVWKNQQYNSLSGCCLILEPNWLYKNIENNIIEDYTLGVKARYQGYKILQVEDARMWGYRTDYKDDIKQLSRSIKGRYQLLKQHPEFKDIIYNDHFFIQEFYQRSFYIIRNILKDPKHILKWLWTFIFVETAILRAQRDYKNKPNDNDWTPLNSGR